MEIFAEMRCILPVVVRTDGRIFKNKLLRLGFKKLYDPNFTRAMANTAILFIRKAV